VIDRRFKSLEMAEVVRVEMWTRVPVPVFRPEDYDSYLADVEVWRQLCGLPKEDQALMLWYSLPNDHTSDIQKKIYNEVGLNDLKRGHSCQFCGENKQGV
jgi:hypothetical protein